jgi:hypothetical protein
MAESPPFIMGERGGFNVMERLEIKFINLIISRILSLYQKSMNKKIFLFIVCIFFDKILN